MRFRFPNTLWNGDVRYYSAQLDHTRVWHTARWTADIIPNISYQTIGRFYHFITRDPVTSIYMSQGFYIALYFTLLAWIISLYTKIAFKISTYSYHYLFILFISGILPFTFDTSFLKFLVITMNYNIGFLNHYLWPMTLMLIALYPYWQVFFNKTWDEKHNTTLAQSVWYIIILLTAFSSNAIFGMYLYVQGVIGLYFFITHPQKDILEKIKYFLLTPPSYVKPLYFGGTLCAIAILSEYFYGISMKSSINYSISEYLKLSISLLIPYYVTFLVYYCYYISVFLFQKKYKKIFILKYLNLLLL